MKNLLFLVCISAFGGQAFAANSTIEFEATGVYYVNNKQRQIDFQKLNKELAEKDLDGIPEKFVVNENAGAYGKIVLGRIEAAEDALEQQYFFNFNHGYLYEFPTMCYRGRAADVPKIINAMMGTFLNEEQGILATRYGTKTIVERENFKSEESLNEYYEGGNDETKAWLNFDTKSKNVLVMSDLGPQGDGTELYSTVIKPCR